jgi:putative sporulation protein YyaC
MNVNKQIYDFICDLLEENKEVVFIGIGSSGTYLDSIGPRIGTELAKHYPYVYGTIEDPLHALNAETKYSQIKKRHPNANVVAIDAMVSKDYLGKIITGPGSIKPGAGVGKNIESIGSHCIKIATLTRGQECYLRDKILNLSSEATALRENLETNVSIISRAIVQALVDYNKKII